MVDRILDSTIGALNTSLNLRQLEQNVISSNIANADTPGYRAQEVDFEQAFRTALALDGREPLEASHRDHMVPRGSDPVNPEIVEQRNGIEGLDGNTVDRANEQTKMSENEILYNASVEMLRKKLKAMEYAITEGGGGGGR